MCTFKTKTTSHVGSANIIRSVECWLESVCVQQVLQLAKAINILLSPETKV